MFKTRTAVLAAALATAALGVGAGSASAACVAGVCTDTQQVTGTPLSTLAMGVPAPPIVAFASFGPGVTSSGLGTVLVTSTGAWSLSAADTSAAAGVTAGHMSTTPGAGLCPAGSELQTSNPLNVTSAGTAALGTSSAGLKNISGAAQQIANGAVTDTLTNTYGISVGAGEPMSTGCVYSATVTYTLQ